MAVVWGASSELYQWETEKIPAHTVSGVVLSQGYPIQKARIEAVATVEEPDGSTFQNEYPQYLHK